MYWNLSNLALLLYIISIINYLRWWERKYYILWINLRLRINFSDNFSLLYLKMLLWLNLLLFLNSRNLLKLWRTLLFDNIRFHSCSVLLKLYRLLCIYNNISCLRRSCLLILLQLLELLFVMGRWQCISSCRDWNIIKLWYLLRRS